MKLKTLVTTMIVAGAVSANAFADDMQAQLDAMKAQIAQMQATMNTNNATTGLPSDGWFNRISISGMANIDANGSWSHEPVGFANQNPSDIQVTNANLFVDANVSDWTKLHLGAVFSSDNSTSFNLLRAGAFTSNETDRNVNIDEAYATIGNFAKSPFYLKAGQQYLPFGDYTPYGDITPSFTQVLSQVNNPSAVAGFVANNGVNGSVYALEGLNKISGSGTVASRSDTDSKDSIRNWGASLGVQNAYNNIGYKAGLGYLYNMADVTGIATMLSDTGATTATNGVSGYTHSAGAVAANAGVKVKAFDADAKYVTAVQKFNAADVSYDGNGAKPAAWTVDAGYSFPVLSHDSRVGLGYQGTKEASGVQVYGTDSNPAKTRYLANYTVNVSKFTDLGFEIRHDVDYSVSNGGTGNSANTATARLAVKFA